MRNKEVVLSDALKNAMKEMRLDEMYYECLLQTKWHEIVGTTIARYTKSVFLKNKILTIHTDIAPLKQELLYNKGSLIEKVNLYFNANLVQDVFIQ